MSKLTHQQLIDLIEADISDVEGDFFEDIDEDNTEVINPQFKVDELDELLADFDDVEHFELSDQYENEEADIGSSPTLETVSKWFTMEKKNVRWVQQPFEPPSINLNILRESDGPNEIWSPIHYFSKYFGDQDFENMAFFTNLYAIQNTISKFKPTTAQEMKDFIAVHLVMGCLKFPRIRMYWEESTRINVIANNMCRDRFFCLRSNFHVLNNLDIPVGNKDKFIKVRPLYDILKKRCAELPVERNLCVDEQIVPFKGHHSVKQYIRGKPNPWGLKIFLLCGQSGLVYNLILYQGSMNEISDELRKGFGLGGAVVLALTEQIESNCHYLSMDNFFTSFNLFYTLQKKQIYATGTIRPNRFCNPPFLTDKVMKKMGRGTTFEVSSNVPDANIGLVKWYDNKPVYLASNVMTSGEVDIVKRWDRSNKKYIDVERPEIVRHYNKTMGGVDKHDQLVSFYRCFIKSKKWTLRMVSHAFDMAVCNSWLEYVEDTKKLKISKKDTLDLLSFRMTLAKELISIGKVKLPLSKKKGRPSSSPLPAPQNVFPSPSQKCRLVDIRPPISVQQDTVGHMPRYDTQKEATRCKYQGCVKGRTHVFCRKCNVHLCFTTKSNCFEKFHD